MDISKRIEQLVVRDADLSRSSFDDVNLSHSWFKNVALRAVRFEDVDLSGVEIEDCNLKGMKIRGVLVEDLFKAYNLRTGGQP